MVEDGRADKERGKIQIKVFLVPCDFKDLKGNININTNIHTKISREQIIDQAFKLHSQGNISEASKYYQYFIEQGFKDHRVL